MRGFWKYGKHQSVCLPGRPGAWAVECSNLEAGYGDIGPVLKGLDLSVAVRERIALTGANGSGKSTLLKAIAGVLPASRGKVLVFGNPLGSCHHRVAYLAQRDGVRWDFPITVRNLVVTGRYVHLGWLARPSAEDFAAVDIALEQMGLTDVAQRQIRQLSGGQKQRVLLARALAQQADLFLLDEPLNALDKASQESVLENLDRLAALGKTLIISTHELDGVIDLVHRVCNLERGVVSEFGQTEQAIAV